MAYAFIEKKNVELEIGVTAVPEPQAYALMLAGIGMVGFAARRRLQRGD
ncbi:MAG: PEP-CTERM sorting domain-containing protein [Rhodocyclaceae bacterium]|nr:PEP-CTERM sorting domain-containing protein [Rhodocyclaceae bacterium]